MKERPILFSGPMVRAILEGRKTQTRRVCKLNLHEMALWIANQSSNNPNVKVRCPYGQPGDRLWVREMHYIGGDNLVAYRADSVATFDRKEFFRWDDEWDGDWRPSIHMPRWASRILLEIVSVRVERLQDISEADALAEGMTFPEGLEHGECPKTAFWALWGNINGPQSWHENPWVWVIEFQRVQQ